MKNSHIEWCDNTFNPWIGCRRVSPACVHCYIERTAPLRVRGMKLGDEPVRTSAAYWKQPLTWNREAELEGQRLAMQGFSVNRPRVFCLSLGDWLDDRVPIKWLADLLKLIHDTPHLDWLLLTKRPENWRGRIERVSERFRLAYDDVRMPWATSWLEGDAPENVWLGTTVENQAMAEERIPLLLQIPAKVRFLSCEPLLEAVDLEHVVTFRGSITTEKVHALRGLRSYFDVGARAEISPDHEPRVHWIICGGESGPGARPMHPDWARSLRDQCQVADVPFFFKQWGEWVPAGQSTRIKYPAERRDILPGNTTVFKYGKYAAGRRLDGREWNEFPKVEVAA